MSTTFTIYFDGQFWVGVLERQDAGLVRAAKVTFGPEPSDTELYEWVGRHGNALVGRLDATVGIPEDRNSRIKRPNPQESDP